MAVNKAVLAGQVAVRVLTQVRQRVARELLAKVMLVVELMERVLTAAAAGVAQEQLVRMALGLVQPHLLVLVVLVNNLQFQVQRLTMLVVAAVDIT
jgi:hypothetical protein